jgi:hypothetical protein
MQGTALPPLSGGASHKSATAASLAHPKFTGGSCDTHLLQQACLLKVHAGVCPSPFLRSTQVTPHFLLRVLFSSLFCIQYFSPWAGVRLSRGLCWFIPGVAVGIQHATYSLTCWLGAGVWLCGSPPGFSV